VPSFHWKLRLAVDLCQIHSLIPELAREFDRGGLSTLLTGSMMQPDCAPFSRRMRVNLRVSTPRWRRRAALQETRQ